LKQYLSIWQLYKAKKLTENLPIPEHVEWACEINDMICGKAGMIELDDDIEDGDELQVEVQEEVKEEVKEDANDTNRTGWYVAQRKSIPPASSRKSTCSTSQTLLTNIGLALDPASRQSCHSDIALQMSQANYMSSLTSQLHDANWRADDATQQADSTNQWIGKLCARCSIGIMMKNSQLLP
jgi:hypothetical protein